MTHKTSLAKRQANARWRAKNAHRLRQENKEWRDANPLLVRENNLKRTGFTVALFESFLVEQNGLCAICCVDLRKLNTKHVHADHCHETGEPRGVLCHGCNTGLGAFRDSPARLALAIDYLNRRRYRMADDTQIGEDEVPLPEKWKHDPTIKLRLTQIEKPRPGWTLDGVYRDRGLGLKAMWRVVLIHDQAHTAVGNGESFDLAYMDACAKALLIDQKDKTDG